MLVRLTKQSSSLLRNHIHGLFCSAYSLASSPTHVVSGAPADVADVTDAADLVFPPSPGSSTVKPLTDPTLLQPRVVIYDGVCHLCHGGLLLFFFFSNFRSFDPNDNYCSSLLVMT